MKGMIKIVGLVLVGLLIGAGGLFGAAQLLGVPLGKSAAAEDEKAAHDSKHEVHQEGVMVPLKERIVNLADPGILRYLKTTITLEITDPNAHKGGGGDHGKPKKGEEMPADLRAKGPMIEDYVTTMLTSKTTSEIMTPQGKAVLKDELKNVLNHALKEDRVLAVYFVDFVIQ